MTDFPPVFSPRRRPAGIGQRRDAVALRADQVAADVQEAVRLATGINPESIAAEIVLSGR